jgi:hypothetical protein
VPALLFEQISSAAVAAREAALAARAAAAAARQGQTPPTPPAPPTLPIPAATDIGTLTSQLTELTIQRAGLKAQWDGLRRQLENMQQSNPSRPAVVEEWAQVGSQMAQVDGQIAAIATRIQQQQGKLTIPGGRDMPPPRRQMDPDLPIAGAIAVMLALILPISIAYAMRMFRRHPAPLGPRTDDFGPRFDRLEHAVDAIAIEVERVSEGQRFVTKILAERPATANAEPLALGAGPAEPIRVQEREGVRQGR